MLKIGMVVPFPFGLSSSLLFLSLFIFSSLSPSSLLFFSWSSPMLQTFHCFSCCFFLFLFCKLPSPLPSKKKKKVPFFPLLCYIWSFFGVFFCCKEEKKNCFCYKRKKKSCFCHKRFFFFSFSCYYQENLKLSSFPPLLEFFVIVAKGASSSFFSF